jgi:hypothetical protein
VTETKEEAMKQDLRRILELDSGKRVIGRILENNFRDRTTLVVGSFEHTAFNEGFRDAANMIANTIRDIDPHLIAECEIAVREFEKQFEETEEYDE